jgi:transcriptional regulator with XRE-family HTH domain
MGTSAKVTKARRLLARNMRARREQLGVSQEKLAELSQLHRTYISSVERCQRNIGIDGIERIAKALGLALEELLADS